MKISYQSQQEAAYYELLENASAVLGSQLRLRKTDSNSIRYAIPGYTNKKFRLTVELSADRSTFKLAYDAYYNSPNKRLGLPGDKEEKTLLLEEFYQSYLIDRGFVSASEPAPGARPVTYVLRTNSTLAILAAIEGIHNAAEEDSLFEFDEEDSASEQYGVSFEGTQFDRLAERGATFSGMFLKLVCDATGMDPFLTQAEYEHLNGGQIDGVEFNSIGGDVISLYECQSGIRHGKYLDPEHANKILSGYLYGDRHASTVKKIVVLAGGYKEEHLARFRDFVLHNPGKQVYLLRTTRQDNLIGVEVVDMFSSDQPAPKHLPYPDEMMEFTEVIERIECLEREVASLKNRSVLRRLLGR